MQEPPSVKTQWALRVLADAEGGCSNTNSLLRGIAQTEGLPAISEVAARRWLHEMLLNNKRYRYSVKNIRRKLSAGSLA